MKLERLTNFEYDTEETIEFKGLRGAGKIKEAMEEVRETKEDVLVEHDRFTRTLVLWNDKLDQVQVSMFHPIASYTLKDEEAAS